MVFSYTIRLDVAEAFESYISGAAQMPEYAARFADLLEQSRHGSGLAAQDASVLLRSAVSAGLVGVGHPAGLLSLAPDQIAATAQAAGRLSASAVHRMTGRRQEDIPAEDYDLLTDPAKELTRRVAAAIRKAAGVAPLVLFLDTGEVIGPQAWEWLRRVMLQTGAGVIWVIAARFETEREAGASGTLTMFVREIGDEYLSLMSPSRFDDAMISQYLADRTGGRNITGSELNTIAQFTRGLPLAVSFTADLLQQGQDVEHVCRDVGDGQPSSVISALARRYLVHAEQGPYPVSDPRHGDLDKILGLALAYGDLRDDPDMLAALWDVADPLPVVEDLASRHDFVLPMSRRLHTDVRDTLRIDMLDPYRRRRVRSINLRALSLIQARLDQARVRWTSLDDQLDHAGFTNLLLALLWHRFWADNQDGMDLLTGLLPILAVADSRTADAAAALSDQFSRTFSLELRTVLESLTEVPRPRSPDDSDTTDGALLSARRVRLDSSGVTVLTAAAPSDLFGAPADRDAAVKILRARSLAAQGDDSQAVFELRAAGSRTRSHRLREAAGRQAMSIARGQLWPSQRQDAVPVNAAGLAAARTATTLLAGNTWAWHYYGTAQLLAGNPRDALQAFDQAVTLDSGNASAHNSRGNALYELERHEEALAAYGHALALDPDHAFAHTGRGNALYQLGRPEEALEACDRSISLNPDFCNAHNGRANALDALGRHEKALDAFDRAICLNPSYFWAHNGRGNVLYKLERHEEALAAYDQAIVLNPACVNAHRGRSFVLMSLGRPAEALQACDRAVSVNPDNALTHQRRGILLYMLGRLQDAIAEFDETTRLRPEDPAAYIYKGMTLVDLDDLDGAAGVFETAARLGVGDSGASMLYLAAISWHRKQAADAREKFTHVIGNLGKHFTPFYAAELEAIALCGLDRPGEAERCLRLALPSRTAHDDHADPRRIYQLLSDPPIPGIDKLLAIAKPKTR